ncbi:hypothetical protein VKT23_014409 [Stygiomarasmius scandens]|uniref:FAD-binding domain-containing protein n=1 Tax=Marasmiellus scandens TaxID=2682957 RepID=A0ABR1J0W7_9AGAR
MYQTKTKHILNFIVIGGSIGGLSTAYCIRQAGHNITLLEKHDISVFQSQKDSGLRIPPNMTRLLNEFPGAKEMLEEKATISPGHFLVEGSVRMAKMTYKEEVISDLGALYYRVPYLDLWNYLYGLCISCNVQCKFNSEVADIIISAPDLLGVRTVLTTGENINGDIIIGADGHNSIVRDFIITDEAVEGPEDEPEQTDLLEVPQLIRLSIPLKEMEKDPELQSLTENNWWTVWMGYGQFHNAGKEGNEQYGLNIYYPFKQYEVVDMDWNIRKPCLGLDELEATEYGSQ